jgi:hypothetical protein
MNKQQAIDTLRARLHEIYRRTGAEAANPITQTPGTWLAALQEHASGGVMHFAEQPPSAHDFITERPYLLMAVPTTTDTRLAALKSVAGKPEQISQRQRQYSTDDLEALKALGWQVVIS